jgi:small-conductance mechanosensitive channel
MEIQELIPKLRAVLSGLASAELYSKIVGMVAAVLLVLLSFKILQVVVGRALKGRIPDQRGNLIRKLIRYTGFTIVVITVFKQLGIDLSALLGAAGIAGIAVGFAAQTSVSNVISGLFLISEKPFQLEDVIQVGDITGIVQSIDLLSIKLQTFDNRFVRIPNETIIKTNVVNITRFPIRRLDVTLMVDYAADLDFVTTVLEDIARKNIWVLDNPEPLIVMDKFENSGVEILFGLWFEKSNFLKLKNSIMIDVRKRFALEGITIPFPQMDVHLSQPKPET